MHVRLTWFRRERERERESVREREIVCERERDLSKTKKYAR